MKLCVLFQISLVDLAGSERAAKTGATAEQLKVTSFALNPPALLALLLLIATPLDNPAIS